MHNITRINRNTYEIRISYTVALTGKRGSIRRRFVGALKDARLLRDELKEAAEAGELAALTPTRADNKPLLADWLDDYLAFRKARLSHSAYTIEGYYLAWIVKDVGGWRVDAIDLNALNRLVDRWTVTPKDDGQPYSPATIKNRIGLLRRFLAFVFKASGKDAALVRDVELPPQKPTSRTGRALEAEEARRFLSHIAEHYPQHYALIFMLLVTGQRFGTVTALRWIDIAGGWITFTQSHYLGVVKEGNKSGKVVRLPLTPALEEVLATHKSRLIAVKHPNLSTGLVFPADTPADKSSTNGFQVSASLRSVFSTTCESLGLAKITPHDFRRTFNTLQIEAGLDGSILRSITAHSSIAMTDHYYYGSRAGKERALKTVEDLMQNTPQ